MKQQIGTNLAAKPINCRSINGNSERKGTLEFAGHDGYIMLLSINITECQTNEFDSFFLHKLHYFFRRVFHGVTSFLFIQDKYPIGV